MIIRIICILLFGLLSLTAYGEEKLWRSEISLGLMMTTGNTDKENITGQGKFIRESEKWRQNFHVDALRSSTDDELTAQKIYVSAKSDYKFGDEKFFFSRVSYEDDRFSGFDYQLDYTLGYGQSLLDTDKLKFEAHVGPGYRWSEFDDGASESEAIVRIAGDLHWKLSDTTVFEQTLSTEIGGDATISRSVSSLKTVILGQLAMKLSYAVKHNSKAPEATHKTDTEISVTLVYRF